MKRNKLIEDNGNMTREMNIVKEGDWYKQIDVIRYKQSNVLNMLNTWRKAINSADEWLSSYDEQLEKARLIAEETVEQEIKQREAYVLHVLEMTEEERYKYWYNRFLKELEDLNVAKTRKEELVSEQEKNNLKYLEGLKLQYEQDKKNKEYAVKLWTIK